ncbi:MAG: DNA glycosylase [Bacillota bacterium]|nr:DNA glycosylase [Bacillota bacterium]
MTAFDLENTVTCGQAFRWRRVGDSYHCVVRGRLLVAQSSNGILQVSDYSLEPVEVSDLVDLVVDYFCLQADHAHTEAVLRELDPVVAEAIDFAPGIRILAQEPWECLISYVISARNFIPSIRSTVARLAERFGERVSNDEYEQVYGMQWYAFPTADSLADASVRDIEECGAAFRARYISKLANLVASGEVDLTEIAWLPYRSAKEKLMSLYGVGPKIAECVLLSSMRKYEAFPIDVWISRVLRFVYLRDPKASLKQMEAFAKSKFGDLAGFAEQYLFHWARTLKGDYLRRLDQATK